MFMNGKLKAADMITKPPFERDNKVYILGRKHLHVYDTEAKTFNYFANMGEDKADETSKKWKVLLDERED